MKRQNFPIYNIEKFQHFNSEHDFYTNIFSTHLREHHFIQKAHKHDFYLCVLFTNGKGTHEIDFKSYKIKPGSVFFMSPGQVHNWNLSEDIEGYIFFHTENFYNLNFYSKTIKDYPFFNTIYNSPVIYLKNKNVEKITVIFNEILTEYNNNELMKYHKLCAFIEIIYIEFSRLYEIPQAESESSKNYLLKLRMLELFIDKHYKKIKSPTEYASMMNMSEKHLNRICKSCLDKTTTELISDRIILEAKRMLIRAEYTVSEVANELGIYDNSYFARLFKKKSGLSPLEFMKKER